MRQAKAGLVKDNPASSRNRLDKLHELFGFKGHSVNVEAWVERFSDFQREIALPVPSLADDDPGKIVALAKTFSDLVVEPVLFYGSSEALSPVGKMFRLWKSRVIALKTSKESFSTVNFLSLQ